MDNFLVKLASDLEPTMADKALTLVLGLVGLALTYLATRVAVWSGKGSYRLSASLVSSLYNYWKPKPCPVAVEILATLADPSAIIDEEHLLAGVLKFVDAEEGLTAVVNDEGRDLLLMLPDWDIKLINQKARIRHKEVTEREDKFEQQKEACKLRNHRVQLEKKGKLTDKDVSTIWS